MISYTLFLTLILGTLTSCANAIPAKDQESKIVFKTLKSISEELNKKYNLEFSGVYEEGDKDNDNKYKVIGLIFSTNIYIPKFEARKMVLATTKIILEKLNTDEIRPYLTVFPFTEKNIQLSIIVKTPQDVLEYSKPSYFGNHRGTLYYRYNIPTEKYKTTKEYETYPEALQFVNEHNQGITQGELYDKTHK